MMRLPAGGDRGGIDVATMSYLESQRFDEGYVSSANALYKAALRGLGDEKGAMHLKNGLIKLNEDYFFIEDHNTTEAAKQYVDRLADVQQEHATAWRKYAIYGLAKKRAELTKMLP